jgi:hypothetical protein
VCVHCGATYPADEIIYNCKKCGHLLAVKYPLDEITVKRASPDSASFFVAYTGNLSKRSMTTGASVIDVPVSNISTVADIVVFSDYVYVATTDGKVHKGDAVDFTPLSTYGPIAGSPAINLPLIITDTTLYVAPNNATLHAVRTSNMASKWGSPFALRGANTGAPYALAQSNTIYAAAGNYVQKLTDAGGSASEVWYFNASAPVNSGPIQYNAAVYFGRNNNAYYALDTTAGGVVATWPYNSVNGNATSGPWIDQTNGNVLFGSTGGDLDAFVAP